MSKTKSFSELERREFVALKRQYVHPANEVSQPNQLVGREQALNSVRNAFERDGSNIFIWGQRGVGKTSLAHTAAAKYSDIVALGPAIACEKNSSISNLFQDLARRAIAKDKSLLKNSSVKIKLEALGLSVEGQLGGFRPTTEITSVNQASELLGALFPSDFQNGKKTVIIIDEFDQLENQDTINFLTSLAKQMSVDALDVKIVYCGVASDL
ncbi:ATP-binding protein [Acidimangrovimonas pyrenivorans]|uniref:ATP-binding protein n=1 Tax=Acidimangrovimonas pyrenivorans TaxID=2030798 RepID=A0ABV7AC87_9RHOB